MDLFLELIEAVPTTVAGAVALVVYLDQVNKKDPWKFEDNYATPLIGALATGLQSHWGGVNEQPQGSRFHENHQDGEACRLGNVAWHRVQRRQKLHVVLPAQVAPQVFRARTSYPQLLD